jgi:hypothetical protein
LTYQDATNSNVQFSAQPNLPTGGTIIYAQSNQATLANSVTVNQSGTAYESVTVSHLIANTVAIPMFLLRLKWKIICRLRHILQHVLNMVMMEF